MDPPLQHVANIFQFLFLSLNFNSQKLIFFEMHATTLLILIYSILFLGRLGAEANLWKSRNIKLCQFIIGHSLNLESKVCKLRRLYQFELNQIEFKSNFWADLGCSILLDTLKGHYWLKIVNIIQNRSKIDQLTQKLIKSI